MNKRIVITGNIGIGKSTVTKIFNQYGYEIISADEVSAYILKENQSTISKLFNIDEMLFDDFKKILSDKV